MPSRIPNAAVNSALVASQWALAVAAAHAGPAVAQSPESTPVAVDSIVVTATRTAERSFDVPASVTRIDAVTIRDGQPMVNLSETLVRVPGSCRTIGRTTRRTSR